MSIGEAIQHTPVAHTAIARPAIDHVLVAIPARNEQRHVADGLHAVLRAADHVPPGVTVTVVLACDSCDDGTAEIARSIARRDERLLVVEGRWGTAGATRARAVDHALSRLPRGTVLQRVWIATTDADTQPTPTWIARQLVHAGVGAAAVAGIVELMEDEDLTSHVRACFARTYTFTHDTHAHVHGANLGVRADAYVAAGGFPAVAVAEDHALWNVVGRLGFHRLSPVDVVVATSARLHGRAAGGFADTLAGTLADESREMPA